MEQYIENTLPPCVKILLKFSAYDSLSVLEELNEQRINEIEEFISECGQNVLNGLSCCHHDKYKKQTKFKFLPGHRAVLLSLSKIFQKSNSQQNISLDISQLNHSNGAFSVILNELIQTAQTNTHKFKNNAEYSDIIRYFFTYVYLMSGKSAYETLQKNLPIPSTKTICKCFYNF